MADSVLEKLTKKIRNTEARALDLINRRFGKYSIYYGILGIHVRRRGFLRPMVGGAAQYLGIPYFFFVHLQLLVLDRMIKKIDDIDDIDWEKYLVIDRHKIDELCLWDRLNCVYCGWTNGLMKLHDDIFVRLLGSADFAALTEKPTARMLISADNLAQNIGIAYVMAIWEVVRRLLDYNSIRYSEALEAVEQKDLEAYNPAAKKFLQINRAINVWLTDALSELESAWCPIRHLKEGIFPGHHENFLDPDEVSEILEILTYRGTLKKPSDVIFFTHKGKKKSARSVSTHRKAR